MSIVFDDEPDKSWCDQPDCGGLLIERKDSSSICSICLHEYLPDSVKLHKSKLGPTKGYYDKDDGPELINIREYTEPRKKKPSILDKEDRIWASQGSGRSIIDYDEFYPEGEDNNNRR